MDIIVNLALGAFGVLLFGIGVGEHIGRRKTWPGRPRKDPKTGRFVKGNSK